ncbi:S8 family peptidase [Natranaerobius thermophilus]|uniref:Peptidase S8 and S53 subtilisin kexin sedolisin n=1 Tax=Natranaerobius thermophilus (strain ATCC BAA-1301 / DSM 18059 / JW/NM-WN-LF) TaxID=457570 RepID=B2A4M5_NATTJ|nr:S8 family peptidase [Natranaerobius thermophilus]ACB85200.1 peptidase S8 and S53 subtilisin kexin sedolisin [Natranaerobius thermophilus JW/NM-WN-LF]
MIRDSAWIPNYNYKLCPKLKNELYENYKPSKMVPTVFYNSYKQIKKKIRKFPVIVQVKFTKDNLTIMDQVASLAQCRIKKKYYTIFSFSTDLTEVQLKKLLADDKVIKVWYDGEVTGLLEKASKTVNANKLWDLELTGEKVTIAVLDTGVYEHPCFENRIKKFRDFVNNGKKTYDDNGHGTHVAGCIASKQNEDFGGVAPKAEIVGVKVLNKLGSGRLSNVLDGIQWCIENKENLNLQIMNLSLGFPTQESYRDDPLCQMVEKAWEAGIVVCAAAGNSGPDNETINSPGIHPQIITVGASNDRNADYPEDNIIADFSSRGPTRDGHKKPDVVAPGVDIVSLRSPSSFLDKVEPGSRIGEDRFIFSGTSMATPICVGAIAQLLHYNKDLEPDEIKSLLMGNAREIPGVNRESQGTGIIDSKEIQSNIREFSDS